MSASAIEEIIQRALRRRAEGAPGTVFRVLNGAGDGAPPGLVADRYGDAHVVLARAERPDEEVSRWCAALQSALRPTALVLKRIASDPTLSTSTVWSGSVDSDFIIVSEDDVFYRCRLDDGVQTGLFIDHRDARRFVAAHAAGAEVLNLFAYTGTFSVRAVRGGAKRVTSVDVSKRALAWARENMEQNNFDPNVHRWFADDVLQHLERARRQYDLVVLDPPVFGRAGKRRFQIPQDLETLVTGAALQLAPQGVLVVSTHATQLTPAAFEAAVTQAFTKALGSAQVVLRSGLPAWDHPVASNQPTDRGAYLKTLAVVAPP